MSNQYPIQKSGGSRPIQASKGSRETVVHAEYEAYPVPRSRAWLPVQLAKLILVGAIAGWVAHFVDERDVVPAALTAPSGPEQSGEARNAIHALLEANARESLQRQEAEQKLQELKEEQIRMLERQKLELEQRMMEVEQARKLDEQASQIRALAQTAAERIVSQYGGGQNVTGALLSDTSWSCHGGNCSVMMRASWNGAWIATNFYWVEGILYVDGEGHTKFQESERSQSLADLSPAKD